MSLIFVDCEAEGPCPEKGFLTEFGAVEYKTKKTFHGILWEAKPDPSNPAQSIRLGERHNEVRVMNLFKDWLSQFSGRSIFVSDNPAYDFQWINHKFWTTINENPFGHSGRRISDFFAGLEKDWFNTQKWKSFRVTPHDHNPVNDAMGNVEAFERILNIHGLKF